MNRIKYYRRLRGYTIRELAMESGVHFVSISRYETNKRVPSVLNLTKLARALGCKVDDLIGNPDDTTAKESA